MPSRNNHRHGGVYEALHRTQLQSHRLDRVVHCNSHCHPTLVGLTLEFRSEERVVIHVSIQVPVLICTLGAGFYDKFSDRFRSSVVSIPFHHKAFGADRFRAHR